MYCICVVVCVKNLWGCSNLILHITVLTKKMITLINKEFGRKNIQSSISLTFEEFVAVLVKIKLILYCISSSDFAFDLCKCAN